MLDVLQTVLSFLVAIAVLVAIHEFGHFWVAKKLGVKVLRYSIGFGKPLWMKRAGPDQTEYVIAALPFGGFVRMLDERDGEVAEEEKHRAFNRQPLWKRFLIVLAGPAFNFILAILLYWGLAVVGVAGLKPVIGQVAIDSPAARAGLQSGMEIVSTEGWSTPTWEAVFQESLPRLVETSSLTIEAKDQQGYNRTYTIDLSEINLDRDIRRPFGALGIYLFDSPAVIDEVLPDKAAQKAGLLAGDTIVRLDDKPVIHWNQIGEYIADKAHKTLPIVVQRDGQLVEMSVTPDEIKRDGHSIGLLGVKHRSQIRITDEDKARHQLSVFEAVPYAMHRTWNISYVTAKVLGLMVTLQMSLSNISGPINIAVVAGESASIGLDRYIIFLALVSISLGILNLLPIPVLDGGHLMYYIIEWIKGSPVSETMEAIGQRVGIMLLMLLMMLAVYNDIMRFNF